MNEQQERAIAQGLRAGEPEAWRTLYDSYSEQVWRSVARLVGPNTADVADVVQETFLAAARSAGKFDPQRGSLWAWLTGIFRNQVALHFRKKQQHDRIREFATLSNFDEGRADGHPPPVVLQSAETAALVRKTLSALNQDYGMLLTAKYLNEETVAEIAAQEQTSTEAVRSKLARARRAFRKTFDRLTADFPVSSSGQTDDQ